ncbi:hypothetical protein LTR37_000263 [Vermiconidia calcicola]|uniref:Uncharacterized protein n=1 Tax=Vermiconidia calcicola TaxID=1690605 RepID=A0ACC3NZC0_9PEZI|nr:hypothetical protein LTR37_000263 [Vermiconidia calcicola]
MENYARREKGPLLQTKQLQGNAYSEKVFLKDDLGNEESRAAKPKKKVVKQFDSSSIASPFLDPKVFERKT